MIYNQAIQFMVIESLGDFSQDILFDSQLFKKIKKVDYSITEYSGFNRKLWENFGLRKNIMYYGLSLKEKALKIIYYYYYYYYYKVFLIEENRKYYFE